MTMTPEIVEDGHVGGEASLHLIYFPHLGVARVKALAVMVCSLKVGPQILSLPNTLFFL